MVVDGMQDIADFYAWLLMLPGPLQGVVLGAVRRGEIARTREAAEPWLIAYERAAVAELAAQGGGEPDEEWSKDETEASQWW